MITEAVLIGFKEGAKITVVGFVFYAFALRQDRTMYMKPFLAGISLVFLLSLTAFLPVWNLSGKEYISKINATSLAILLVTSGFALLHRSGINLFAFAKDRKLQAEAQLRGQQGPIAPQGLPVLAGILFITLLFFAPDSIGSLLYLKDVALMKERAYAVALYTLAGFLPAGLLAWLLWKVLNHRWVGSFFDFPQLLLFLAIVKLLGGGIKGFTELSLIPSVQRGFMKFIHDFIHQTFVLLMVPDHPLLKTTVWNFIGFFFGPNFASVASLFILLALPLLFITFSLFSPLPEPDGEKAAIKRKVLSHFLSDRRRKALPILIFVFLIIIAWFSQTGESVSRLYIPKPRPVVDDKGAILIPVNDPTMDLKDGSLHTFSFLQNMEDIRLLVIKKPDNTITACLDACEICPPDGYGQREGHVVCIYCNTPIPIRTLGEAGGCNPIPLAFSVDDRFLRIEVGEVLKKWAYVKEGKGKEAVR